MDKPSEEDLKRLRAAVVDAAKSGDVEQATNLTAFARTIQDGEDDEDGCLS